MHGDGEQLGFVQGHTPQREAHRATVAVEQRAARTGRRQQLGEFLPSPGALAERLEGQTVQLGCRIEVERAQRTKIRA